MATQNPTTQTPPIIDMGISQFNTTSQTPPPIQTTTQTPEDKIKSGTATAQDFASYNQLKGSQTAGSDLLQQIKPTQVTPPPTQTTAPKIDMGISSFDVQQTTPTSMPANISADQTDRPLPKQETPKIEAPTSMPADKIQNQPIKTEKSTQETPIDFTKIQSVDDWKKQTGGGINNLESWIESRYGTIATQQSDGTVIADINGQKFKWNIDENGNPIKSQIQLTPEEQSKANILQKYSGMDTNQFLTELKSNNIGTDLDKELSNNPNYIKAKAEYEKVSKIEQLNKEAEQNYNTLTGKVIEKKTPLQTLSDKLTSGMDEAKKLNLKSYIEQNDPDLIKKTEELNAKSASLQELVDERDNSIKNLTKQYPGMSKGAIISLADRLNENLNNDIRSREYELKRLSADVQYRTSIAESGLKNQQDIAKEERGYAFDAFKTIQGQEFQKAQTEEERTYQEKQYRLQQSFANPDINSTDPQIATIAANKSVNDILKFAQENGIVIRRDSATILNDAKKFAQENGVSLGEALNTTFSSIVTGGDQYKTVMEGIQRTKIGDKYDYKAVQGVDANGNMMTTGYIAINKQDPTDTFSIGLDGQRITAGTGGGFATTSIPGTGETITAGGNANQNLTSLRGTVIKNTKNVGNDLNNPGNLTRGGVGDKYAIGYVTVTGNDNVTRDFLVFPTLESGYAGVQEDLKAKMTGGSRYVKPTDSLSKLLDVWVGGNGAPQEYKNVVSKASGYNLNNPVSGMDYTKVMAGIKQAEGVGSKVGNDYTSLVPKDTIQQTTTGQGFDPAFSEKYKEVLKGKYPDGIKPGFDAAKKLDAEAKAWFNSTNQKQGLDGKVYTDQQISDLAYVTELLEKTPTEGRKALKEMGYNDKDIANYKAGNVPLTENQKKSSINLIEEIKDLYNNYDWNDATGVHFGMPVIAGTDRADSIQKIEQIVAKMTLPNLGSLKGPMSDKDLAFITKASSNLDVGLSDKQFEQNLLQAYNIAARRAGLPELDSLSKTKSTTTGPVAPKKSPQTESYLKSIGIQ